jgi:hypothetical protein
MEQSELEVVTLKPNRIFLFFLQHDRTEQDRTGQDSTAQ